MRVLLASVLAGIGVRAYRLVVVSLLFGFGIAFAGVLLVVPVIVGFGLSAASAIGWCIWLDKHPEVGADPQPHPAIPSPEAIVSPPRRNAGPRRPQWLRRAQRQVLDDWWKQY